MLIGLTGRARSGKTTVAETLYQHLGFIPLAFADALKESCIHKFNLSKNDVYTQEGKERFVETWGKTVGEILQLEGTEATRGFWGHDFWVKRWESALEDFTRQGHHHIVAPDVRFDNEAQTILDRGGVVIRIDRPDSKNLIGSRDPNHVSEQGISDDLITLTIQNDSTVAELKKKILTIAGGYL